MIPERYKNAKWEDVPEPIQEALEAMPKTKKGIYLVGGVGTGKTHIAYGVKSRYGAFVRVRATTDLLQAVRRDFEQKWSDKELPEQELTNPDKRFLLILDDIGAEKVTDFATETLYRIVNTRYNHKMPTIFTSNLTLSELADHIGERTASRIAEMCEIINLTGDDRRIK